MSMKNPLTPATHSVRGPVFCPVIIIIIIIIIIILLITIIIILCISALSYLV